ncbi:hypothetical protein M0802_005033 [Mischocyttarus mexicanus]|nr:hypothetical protein M0802_005033 [Mischocyttarus mexicanus]
MSKEFRPEQCIVHYKFNKSTAMILHTLEADHLIAPCKERNISTKELHNLTVDDFIELGADENLAKKLFRDLTIKLRNATKEKFMMQKYPNIIETLDNSKEQLNLISAGVAYTRIKLRDNGIDNTFLNSRELVTTNSILCISITQNLNAVNDMEKAIEELYTLVPKNTIKKGRIGNISSALLAGLGLVLCLISRIRKR